MTASAHDTSALRAARIACWFFLITGAGMAGAVAFGVGAPLDFLVDLVFWPLDGLQSASAPETRLAVGIAGGLLAGWSVTLLVLLRRASDEALSGGWAWRAVAGGLVAWFALDGVASIGAGAAGNIIGNLVFLVALGLPLLALRRRPGAREARA